MSRRRHRDTESSAKDSSAFARTPWTRSALCAALGVLSLLSLPGCGGGGGGAGPSGAGQGLVLVSFMQAGLDNVQLSRVLEFRFSEPVNVLTINNASLQIREGNAFGLTVPGRFTFSASGSTVFFEPRLPGLCDLSDGGFKPGTKYRVQLVGNPEEFAIKNTQGQSLNSTQTFEFQTRPEDDPNLFLDLIPSQVPMITSTSPANGTAAAPVQAGNEVVLYISENLDPCTVGPHSVSFQMVELGNPGTFLQAPNLRNSGFAFGASTADQLPNDPFSWGAAGTTTVSPAQTIPATIVLQQTRSETTIRIKPSFGRFPENALIVVQLTFEIEDYGGAPLAAYSMSFTTENLPQQFGQYDLLNQGETTYDEALTTADVNTARSPSKAQGYLLFAGDGDNGAVLTQPSKPGANIVDCSADRQPNDGTKDDFDAAGDITLDTGATNVCNNTTDGSRAVVFEYASFRIRGNATVRIMGVNPAILLVQGDVIVDPGGRLLVRGDNNGGTPQGRGGNSTCSTCTTGTTGGTGVAGGGRGGNGPDAGTGARRVGGDGTQGYFHNALGVDPSVGTTTGPGSGQGQTSSHWTTQTNLNRHAPGGGGGGHASAGAPGDNNGTGTSPCSVDLPVEGTGGVAYGAPNGRMLTPEAGSGGGAGGEVRAFSGTAGQSAGGAGGAGGGFLDITSSGNIIVQGTIDAAGSAGGNGMGSPFNPNYTFQPGTGGGGGGSGGGIRLLTPNAITLGSGATVTAAGGNGGVGGQTNTAPLPTVNNGGVGGAGRVVMEDGDSVIAGLGGATVVPGEGSPGFYRGTFDATRFQGGGLAPQGVTVPFPAGPFNPAFLSPIQSYGSQTDFVAGVPVTGTRGIGKTSILVEVRGYQILSDGSPDLGSATGWYTVGHFRDSGTPNQPTWFEQQPPGGDVTVPAGNVGLGIANLNAREFIQVRLTFFLPSAAKPTDPGPFVDNWIIRFSHDQ